MQSGTLAMKDVVGPFDLQATLESGQTFSWTRRDGRMYETDVPRNGTAWYRTVVGGRPVELRQTAENIEWRSPGDPTPAIRDRLGLDPTMAETIASLPDDGVIGAAKRAFPGLRVVDEPFFPTLVSFILSAQMRVERIHSLMKTLAERFGTAHSLDDDLVYAFPEPGELATVSESTLRDLGLGYRAPYVAETARMVAEGELTAKDIRGLPYEEAREVATGFVGVGEKVADCVLLFSLGYHDPVPLDTWIESAIAEYFPGANRGTYADTSRAIRERLGSHPGVAQTYVFHYLRNRDALDEG
ncbi:DNA-3-methyladenine glycosylase family protein [Halanaeroarchaeum sulfurireducens]|uniref:DNA-(apurinic or apyrimidinic site) lyase n=1 Tax=Halanaeroarchaeum sulfurireducens TaxID=1604004 RepID=A0A0N7FTT8_9EURY|nr:DNA glycosylase [Halanaeroarchaeum sulfurireducens]ALG82479.1 8-oxoguanine DNA glycosylase [Halanaeroarchaeum sulfurireducens]